jgi:hypothetical protein
MHRGGEMSMAAGIYAVNSEFLPRRRAGACRMFFWHGSCYKERNAASQAFTAMKTHRPPETRLRKQRKRKSGNERPEKTEARDAQAASDSSFPGRRFEKGYLVEKPE